LVVPPARADTTMSDNNRVYVKYNDNDFYPLYFVHYRNRPEHLTSSKYFRANSGRAMGHCDRRTVEERCSDHLDATGCYDDDDSLEQMCSDFYDNMRSYYDEHDEWLQRRPPFWALRRLIIILIFTQIWTRSIVCITISILHNILFNIHISYTLFFSRIFGPAIRINGDWLYTSFILYLYKFIL